MDATEICPLTREAVSKLLAGQQTGRGIGPEGRRQVSRWPFPGPVELWVPDPNGVERHTLTTCLNLSLQGVGICCDDPLPMGLELAIAVHQPEVSFHGRAVVRHCTPLEGEFYVGLEFVFDDGLRLSKGDD